MNEEKRFKMYKAGKRWVIAGLFFAGLMLGAQNQTNLISAHANNVATTNVANAKQNAKVVQAKTQQLLNLIHNYQKRPSNGYTNTSLINFNKAMVAAINFVHQPQAAHTSSQVDAMQRQLLTANNQLVKQNLANKTSLLRTIRTAQGINRQQYRNNTVANLNNTLSSSVNVYHNTNASQWSVDHANNQLKAALNGLVYAYNVKRDNSFSAQFLSGARVASYRINGQRYNFAITNQSGTHSYGRSNFVAAGCTENALANAMKLARLVPNGATVQNLAAKFWTVQTGGLNVNQGVSRYNQQSVATVGDYAPISMPLMNNVINRGAASLKLFQGRQSFTTVGSVYYGYGLGVVKGQRVARQIENWRRQGYFITAMVRAAGTNASADHAATILSLAPNFSYGKSINFIDSYHGNGSYNGLVQGLSNTQKLKYVYKLVAYRATDYNGNQIRNNY